MNPDSPAIPYDGPPKSLAEMASEAAEQASGSSGIRCPVCGCPDWKVIDTRRGLGILKRWRVCRNCNKRLVTHEKPIGQKPA